MNTFTPTSLSFSYPSNLKKNANRRLPHFGAGLLKPSPTTTLSYLGMGAILGTFLHSKVNRVSSQMTHMNNTMLKAVEDQGKRNKITHIISNTVHTVGWLSALTLATVLGFKTHNTDVAVGAVKETANSALNLGKKLEQDFKNIPVTAPQIPAPTNSTNTSKSSNAGYSIWKPAVAVVGLSGLAYHFGYNPSDLGKLAWDFGRPILKHLPSAGNASASIVTPSIEYANSTLGEYANGTISEVSANVFGPFLPSKG